MLDQTDFRPVFEAKLLEVEAEFAAKSAEIVAARTAVKAAKDSLFVATQRFEAFGLTVLRATRHTIPMGTEGKDEHMLTLATRQLDELSLDELERKRAAELTLAKASRLLETLEYQLADLRAAAMQLGRCVNPPPIEAPKLKPVERPARPDAGDIDDIVMPPAARGAA